MACLDCGDEEIYYNPCGDCQGGCDEQGSCIEPDLYPVTNTVWDKCEQTIDAIKDEYGNCEDATCTLQFGSLTVILDTVTFNVIGGNGEIEYSRDGVLFQDSPNFLKEPCGTHRYYARQRNNIDCVVSGEATVAYNCNCVPNWVPTENPPLENCLDNVLNWRMTDGCGHSEWRPAPGNPACGCVSNWQPTQYPAITRCNSDSKVEVLMKDGCGHEEYRVTDSTCVPCVTPSANSSASITPATCTSAGVLQANGSFLLGGISNADKYGLSIGSVYNGPSYSAATTFTGTTINPIGLANSTDSQTTYTVRLFNKTDSCYLDKNIVFAQVVCQQTCAFVPAYTFYKEDPTCGSGGASNANGKLLITNWSNADRYQMCEGSLFSCPANYPGAVLLPSSGPVTVLSNISFATGQSYRDFTVRVYNGNQNCYLDTTLRFNNPCAGSTCTSPSATGGTGSAATCTGNVPNNNASILVSGIANADRYGFSLGTVYSGPVYSGATAVTSTSVAISGLTGSNNSQQYRVRLFNGSDTCFVDVAIVVPGSSCSASCVSPIFSQRTSAAATCTGTTPNNNASITVTGISSADKYGISQGSIYTGVNYDGALPVSSTLSITNLNGSTSQTVYVIRIFNGSNDCYIDLLQTVPASVCAGACVSPDFILTSTPNTCTGTTANSDGIVTISSITNGNRYQICLDSLFTCTPDYANASVITGTGSINVYTSLGFTAGQTARPFTVRVYNGSQSCYTDKSITIVNPCISCCVMTINNITLTDV